MVNKVISLLSAEYGKVGKMTVRRGKKYDYLGMILDFSEDCKFVDGGISRQDTERVT